jgi:hypothetical protein
MNLKAVCAQASEGCSGTCSFMMGPPTSTTIAWTQTWDKWGNPTGHNPNTISFNLTCQTCGKVWPCIDQDGVTSVGAPQ